MKLLVVLNAMNRYFEIMIMLNGLMVIDFPQLKKITFGCNSFQYAASFSFQSML